MVPTTENLKSMLRMSLDEREKLLEEIHGIPQRNREDASEIEMWLGDLDKRIQSTKKGTVYELAEAMDLAVDLLKRFGGASEIKRIIVS